MSDLKKQLIRLGSTNPELRPHIRRILKAKRAQKKVAWSYEPLVKYLYKQERALEDIDRDVTDKVSRHYGGTRDIPSRVEEELREVGESIVDGVKGLSELRYAIEMEEIGRSRSSRLITRTELEEMGQAGRSEHKSRDWENRVEQAKKRYVALNRKWGTTNARNWDQFLKDSDYMEMPPEDRVSEIVNHIPMQGMPSDKRAFYVWLEDNGDQLLYRGFGRDMARAGF